MQHRRFFVELVKYYYGCVCAAVYRCTTQVDSERNVLANLSSLTAVRLLVESRPRGTDIQRGGYALACTAHNIPRVLSIECLIKPASPIKTCKPQRAHGVHIKKDLLDVNFSNIIQIFRDLLVNFCTFSRRRAAVVVPARVPSAGRFAATPTDLITHTLQFYLALKFLRRDEKKKNKIK